MYVGVVREKVGVGSECNKFGVIGFNCSLFYLGGGVYVVFLALVLPVGKPLLVVVAVQGAPPHVLLLSMLLLCYVM